MGHIVSSQQRQRPSEQMQTFRALLCDMGKDLAPSAVALHYAVWLDCPALQPLASQLLQPKRAVLTTGGLSQALALDFQVSCCVFSPHVKFGRSCVFAGLS